jgi:hypothetical protein
MHRRYEMKKTMTLLATISVVGIASAGILVSDDFSYSDGSLVDKTPSIGGTWANHSGTAGDLLVSDGAVTVQHGSPSEDANISFATFTSGALYYAFDFSVAEPGNANSISDAEYFAHFKDDGSDFASRLGIENPSNSGDYTIGIGVGTESDAVWGSDLTFGTTYHTVVEFNFSTGVSTLWLDPASWNDTYIVSAADSVPDISAFALRQSDSTWNEGITVDNLIVSTTFAETIPEPATLSLVGLLGGTLLFLRRRLAMS